MSLLLKKKQPERLCIFLVVLAFLPLTVFGEELYRVEETFSYFPSDPEYGKRFNARQSESEEVNYKRFKEHIPKIHLSTKKDWEKLNNLTWKAFFNNIRLSSKEPKMAAFVSNRLSTQLSDHEFFWHQAFISLGFGRYVHRAFNTLGGLDCFYNQQHEDGFIPREISPNGSEVHFFPGCSVWLLTNLPPELAIGSNITDFGLKKSNWDVYKGAGNEIAYEKFRKSILKRKSRIIKRFGQENNSNPPLAAHAEWRHYLASRDRSRLEAVYDVLKGHTEWLEENRKIKSGEEVDGLFWQGGMGSGMDNLPITFEFIDIDNRGLFKGDIWSVSILSHSYNPLDPEVTVKNLAMFDASAQMKLHYDAMANISDILDKETQKELYHKKAEVLKEKINACLWDENKGFYFNAYEKCNYRSSDFVLSAYWGLYAEIASTEQARDMLTYLKNDRYFNTPMPFPAVATSSSWFQKEGDYWRGGVWPPLVYITLKGLMNYAGSVKGAWTVAVNASEKYLAGLAETMFESSGSSTDDEYEVCWSIPEDGSIDFCGKAGDEKRIYEYNSPMTGGRGQRKDSTGNEWLAKDNFVGWGGLGPIGVMQEVAVGLDIHENEIVWHLHRTDEHGIKNLYIGTQSLSFMVTERIPGQLSRENIIIEGMLPEDSPIQSIRVIPKEEPSNEIRISLKQQGE